MSSAMPAAPRRIEGDEFDAEMIELDVTQPDAVRLKTWTPSIS